MESSFIFYLEFHEDYIEIGFDISERIFMLPRNSVNMGLLYKLGVGDEVFIGSNRGRNVQPSGTDGFFKYVYVRDEIDKNEGGIVYRPLYISKFNFLENRSV